MRAPLLVLVFALLALVTLPGLDRPSVIDGREARDALVTVEMQAHGEWLQPLLANEPRFDKPAAGVALEWLARRALHGGLATSRAVRAAAIAALLALVLALATRLGGARVAPFAGLAFATSLGVPLAARADGTAILGSVLAWLGIVGLWCAALDADRADHRPGAVARFAGWVALGLAVAAAGPLAALWPLAGFAMYFTLVRSRRGWRALAPLAGSAIVVGCALPWYGAIATLHGPATLLRAFVFPYGDEPAGPWYAGLLVASTFAIVNAFPWTPLLAAAVRDEANRLREERVAREKSPTPRATPAGEIAREHRVTTLLLSMFLAAALPLVFWPTPPLTAAFQALPAAALLVGIYLERVWRGDAGSGPLMPGATRMTAFVGTVVAVLVAAFAPRLADAATALQRGSALLLVTSWAPLLADLIGRRRLASLLFALPLAVGAPFVLTQVLPVMEPWLTTRPVAEALAIAAPPRAPLVLLAEPAPSLRLAARRNLVVRPEPWDELSDWRAADGRVYLAFAPSRERDVARHAPAPLEILMRSPTLVLARMDVPAPVLPLPKTSAPTTP